ncbi:hypothetical protein CC2G_013248 [Coprinopsis cinerea AmutBmut pab1-1]|nr:hypothetical protein CC2G_013248 [Coprinopsis cinerea AmutBmut pab1-1]
MNLSASSSLFQFSFSPVLAPDGQHRLRALAYSTTFFDNGLSALSYPGNSSAGLELPQRLLVSHRYEMKSYVKPGNGAAASLRLGRCLSAHSFPQPRTILDEPSEGTIPSHQLLAR